MNLQHIINIEEYQKNKIKPLKCFLEYSLSAEDMICEIEKCIKEFRRLEVIKININLNDDGTVYSFEIMLSDSVGRCFYGCDENIFNAFDEVINRTWI